MKGWTWLKSSSESKKHKWRIIGMGMCTKLTIVLLSLARSPRSTAHLPRGARCTRHACVLSPPPAPWKRGPLGQPRPPSVGASQAGALTHFPDWDASFTPSRGSAELLPTTGHRPSPSRPPNQGLPSALTQPSRAHPPLPRRVALALEERIDSPAPEPLPTQGLRKIEVKAAVHRGGSAEAKGGSRHAQIARTQGQTVCAERQKSVSLEPPRLAARDWLREQPYLAVGSLEL